MKKTYIYISYEAKSALLMKKAEMQLKEQKPMTFDTVIKEICQRG